MYAGAQRSETAIEANTSTADRHHALDLLRGLAALAVAQYHFLTWNQVASVQSMGTFAVYAFFVLSGLTMMMVYGERFAQGLSGNMVRAFFRKRLARLLPLLAAIAVFAFIVNDMRDVPAVILTGSGLMALHMPGFLSNSVGAWSIGIELAFYGVFPLIALMLRSWKEMAFVAVTLLVGQHLLLVKLQFTEPFWNYYISPLVFAPFFAIGMLISFDHRDKSQRWLPACLACLAVLLGYSLVVPTDLMRDQLSYFVLTIICGLAVWAAWRSVLPPWLVPAAGLLGDVSYSLYLTHWVVNEAVLRLHLPLHLQWPLFTAAALIGSYACYQFFENPLRKRLGGRRAPVMRTAVHMSRSP